MKLGNSIVPGIIVIFLFIDAIFAQSFPMVNAIPHPVGSGARALGLGGAFIAVADDATAASWNPGALIQLEKPEISVVGAFLLGHQDYNGGDTGLAMGDEQDSRGELNYASIAYPFTVFRKNMVVSLNYQQKYDFLMDVNLQRKENAPFFNYQAEDQFKVEGGIAALTPAMAIQVIPKLSLGLAVNFYTDEGFGNYAWTETTHERGTGNLLGGDFNRTIDDEVTYKNFQAINLSTGLLWDVWTAEDKLITFGAVYHSKYTADIDRVDNTRQTVYRITSSQTVNSQSHARDHMEIDFPMSAGMGLGFRYNDALLFSFDVTWTDWSDFKQKNEETGEETRPLGAASLENKISDTYAVRYGTEYLIFLEKVIVPVRGGLFYDPRPSLEEAADIYGFSVGSGLAFHRLSIDAAYQYRWANSVEGEDIGLKGTSYELNEHLFLTSVTVYF